MVTHILKCQKEYYALVEKGLKSFELRFNDRYFRVGEQVVIIETDAGFRTGKELPPKEIVYILEGEDAIKFGLKPGYVILQLK